MDLANQPVVIDCGTGSIKAGFAGEEKPHVVFPNYLGTPKFNYKRVMTSTLVRDTFIGAFFLRL